MCIGAKKEPVNEGGEVRVDLAREYPVFGGRQFRRNVRIPIYKYDQPMLKNVCHLADEETTPQPTLKNTANQP